MIRAYWAERLAVRRMAPLVILLTAAAQAGRRSTLAGFAVDALLAFLVAAEFRVWDDLADRRRDAISHPERVLVRAKVMQPVVVLGGVLACTAFSVIGFRTASRQPLVVLVLLHAAISVCYAARDARTLATDQVLLARYPAFVFIISSASGAVPGFPVGLAMAATFLALSIYEGLHDSSSPIAGRPAVLAGESCLLVATLVALGGQL
jgi:4-hydroxybenzoate polyprenyltransferase